MFAQDNFAVKLGANNCNIWELADLLTESDLLKQNVPLLHARKFLKEVVKVKSKVEGTTKYSVNQ